MSSIKGSCICVLLYITDQASLARHHCGVSLASPSERKDGYLAQKLSASGGKHDILEDIKKRKQAVNGPMSISSYRPRQRRLIDQLKARLILTIGLLVACFVLSSALGIFAVVSQQQLGEQKVAIHNDVNSLLQAMIDQETGLRGYITTANTTFLDPLTSGRTQYSSALQQLNAETVGANFHATTTVLATVEEKAATWSSSFADPQIERMQRGNVDAARAEGVNAQGKVLFDTFRRAVAQLQQVTDNDLASLQMQADEINYGALAVSILLGILAIVWLWRTFVHFADTQREQLEILKETAAAIGAGDLSARVQDITDADLREVGQTFNGMASTLQEQQNALRDRDILEQVSQLNTLLASSLDLTELMHAFLRNTLPLLDVQIGALYLYDPQTKKLNLFAARGVQPEELQQTFAPGEGLIGRAAQERTALMITRPDQDEVKALRIKTMLGTVLPTSLYHLPLLRGNELLGVLTMGTMYSMREQTRNVLNVIASNVASAISNTQAFGHIQEQARELTQHALAQEQANLALRQQRDELTALNAALEEANRVRSRFLSTMSHELRTPLTSIIGFGQMLLRPSAKTPLNERQTNNVQRILKNAQHLLTLINDVLDLAKVESGRMDVNATEINLKDLLTSVVEETRSVAVERKLRISVEVADDITTIESDPLKLRQIVLNLLSNALKFTEHGGITISATCRTATVTTEQGLTEAEQVAIAVKDTGIGIAPELQARIFEAFYQVDNSNSRKYGGTGLGLSIVREFTALLGGKIEIESQPGQGTTFTVLLPMHVRDRQSLQEVRLNTLHSQGMIAEPFESQNHLSSSDERVQELLPDELLVVAIDDNPDVLQLITASLEQTSYRVVGVQDSSQAVAVVQELRPHVITLDIMMPQVNGWQILHQLKSHPATAAIPVILLTVLEDRSAGYVLGADEYLVKPVARDALLSTLHQLTSTHLVDRASIVDQSIPAQPAQVQEAKDQDTPLKPILLVHNETNVHELVARLVSETGYSLATLDGGQDVMTMIKQASPDLLMLLVQIEKPFAPSQDTFVVESKAVPTDTPSTIQQSDEK